MTVETPEIYVNPYTDFGFKYLFGTELNKDLLISFLNALLPEEQNITELTYLSTEQFGPTARERKQVFDVYCRNQRGERFIVEMQNMTQEFFKDRSVFYATTPIRQQACRGDWDFHLNGVYTIAILNFCFDNKDDSYFHHEVKLMDTHTKEVFYDKLTFIYLEMPKFRKTENELHSMFDKWLFVLKNLARLLERPAALQERIFTRLFEQARIANFSEQKREEYDESRKVYLDNYNTMKFAIKEAREEGIRQGQKQGRKEGIKEGIEQGEKAKSIEIARNLKASGLPLEMIAKATGLTISEIDEL